MYQTHDGTDQLNEKDVLKILSKMHELDCYHPKGPARKPLALESFKILVIIMFDVGLRVSEALPLRVNDFNFSYGIVRIRYAKGGWKRCKNATKYFNKELFRVKFKCTPDCKLCHGTGKIRKDENTVISKSALEKVAQYIERHDLSDNDLLCPSPSFKNKPIHRSWVWHRCKELDILCDLNYFDMLESGKVIEGLSTHAFRKSLTKNMADAVAKDPKNLRFAIRQLRHKDTKTILAYMNPSLEKLAKARQDDKFALE